MAFEFVSPRARRLAVLVIGLIIIFWLRQRFSAHDETHGHREALVDEPISQGKLLAEQIAGLDHHFNTPLVGVMLKGAANVLGGQSF